MEYLLDFDLRVSTAFAPQEDIITRMYWGKNQYYENQKGQLLRHFRRMGRIDCYVDIGAHWGNHAMFMRDFAKEMYLFEPDPLNFSTLSINLPNANKFNCAIGHERKLVGMKHTDNDNSGSSYVDGEGIIAMETLDSFNLKPSLIKIDVEGFELNVLKGAEQTITKHHPIVAIEVENNEDKIDEIMRGWGYNTILTTTNISKTKIYDII